MKLIATQTVTTAGPTITFSDIPQTFTDLYVVWSTRYAPTASTSKTSILFNGSSSNFSYKLLQGDGSGAATGTNTINLGGINNGSDTSTNTFSSNQIYIPNYTGSTNKSYSVDAVSENNATTAYQDIWTGLWSNSAAITSLTITGSSNLLAGSTVSLYGIGPDVRSGSAKATGGIITRSGDYWVHTFTSSGTFTPTTNLSNVEYLVIAGGGSGGSAGGAGSSNAGGGGAGGYRSSVTGESSGGGASAETKLSLSSGVGYTVTIGAGGAAVKADNSAGGFVGNIGNNTTFSTITSTAGGGGAFSPTYAAASIGGSGGGGAWSSAGAGSAQPGAAGTANQGFAGGAGATSNRHGGGGGGAGQTGRNGDDSNGAGGNGVSSSITGSSIFRAGGGGQSNVTSGTPGAGGNGGGGNGVYNGTAGSGVANTGSGGGANAFGNLNNNYFSGAGGSGIVIVRYAA